MCSLSSKSTRVIRLSDGQEVWSLSLAHLCLIPTHQIHCKHRGTSRFSVEHCLDPFASMPRIPEPLSLFALAVCVQAFLPSVFQHRSAMPTWAFAFSVSHFFPVYLKFMGKTSRKERSGFSEKVSETSKMSDKMKFLSPSFLSCLPYPYAYTSVHTSWSGVKVKFFWGPRAA